MKREGLLNELKEEFDERYGFMVKQDGFLQMNSKAMMLWGQLLEEPKTIADAITDDVIEELFEKGEVHIKIRL